MKFLKRAFLVVLVLVVVGLLFREWFYSQLITYRSIGQRKVYAAADASLLDYINKNSGKQPVENVEQIIKAALIVTSKQLQFTFGQNDVDPNKLIVSKSAHCVGYAAFFAATCNYLLNKHHLAGNWNAKPQAGQLYLLGENIHKHFNSAFFKDHDFVVIENNKTGESYAVDPTVHDYLNVEFVNYKK